MRLQIANELLPRLIARAAETAMSNRQVARRLSTLLDLRFHDLKREHRRTTATVAAAERLAFTDVRYETYVQELVDITYAGHSARIEYETYGMLFKARQSLRAFQR